MGESGLLLSRQYVGFDFAPYKIASDVTAFGVEVGFSEGYAGGGGFFRGMMLFMRNGDRLINILAEPIYFMKDMAGDWHKDGTRDHGVEEDEDAILMLSHKTHDAAHDYFDLQLKSRNVKWRQTFQWNPEQKRYLPALNAGASATKK